MWIGYAVPTLSGEQQGCCWNNDGRGCGLEGQRNVTTAPPSGPVQLEGPTHVAILLRVDERDVRKIRSYSLDCPLDAGGLPVVWLTGVQAGESVAYLAKSGEDSAVHAIAMHSGPEAEKALNTFAMSGSTEKLRKSAIFWLAVSRGHNRCDRAGSGYGSEKESRFRADADAQRRGRSYADPRCARERESSGAQAGDVLAWSIEGPAGD
jgi:hypothetical protein